MIDTVCKAAREGGRILLSHYNNIDSISIDTKKANDFVTSADRASEKAIVEILKDNFPDHNIMAEEGEWDNNSSSLQWIIDPLDGTNNYIHSFPVFAISIALEVQKEIVLGVVYDPLRDEIFTAEKGKGAFLNGRKIEVSKRGNLKHALVATGFPFKWPEYFDIYMECFCHMFKHISDMRRTGAASLDICYTSCGRCDAYWELGLSPWDIAAGSIIAKEAGAVITDFNGEYNHVYSGKVLVANKEIHSRLLEIIKKYFSEG